MYEVAQYFFFFFCFAQQQLETTKRKQDIIANNEARTSSHTLLRSLTLCCTQIGVSAFSLFTNSSVQDGNSTRAVKHTSHK